jgi:hypothetical protein
LKGKIVIARDRAIEFLKKFPEIDTERMRNEIAILLVEQDHATREGCQSAVWNAPSEFGSLIRKSDAQAICMQTKSA